MGYSLAMDTRTPTSIAVVDDESNICETVGFALRREGFQVTTFGDGLEAWESFQGQLPDLVILDILMPRLDGLELCRRLRGISDALPIIFLTSKDGEFDRVLGLELGADDYLCKPLSTRELIARVLPSRGKAPWGLRCRSQAEMDELVAAAGFRRIVMELDDHGIFTVSLAVKGRLPRIAQG